MPFYWMINFNDVTGRIDISDSLIYLNIFSHFPFTILYLRMAKNKKPKHIAVAGNIGAGKTTLTEMLSKHYKWIPQFEDVDHNPYLNDFYEDMPRWSFNLQVYFLNSRLNQLLEIYTGTETVIQDRTIYEDAMIFAPNLHEMGLMPKRDFDNYYMFFETLKSM